MRNHEERLNSPDVNARLSALRAMVRSASAAAGGAGELGGATGSARAGSPGPSSESGEWVLPPLGREVNNHVHTTYSFSPYSPTAAAWEARKAGLSVVGSIDHDSIAAAAEMREAAAIVGMGSTTGVEVRVDFRGTPFADRPLNNPDGGGIAYIVVHAVPEGSRARFASFLEPIRAARNERSRRMTETLSDLLTGLGCAPVDYEADVLGCSQFHDGGEVTERHMLYAAASRVLETAGRGRALVTWLEEKLKVDVPSSSRKQLEDEENPYLRYDLLGVFKRELLPSVYIAPGERECVPVEEVVSLANATGAIPAYSYLGDIESSVTGDKRPAQFEDAHLDELIGWVRESGFAAVTYMPPRNTKTQLARLSRLCRAHDLIEISGVDINSPRQSFNCPDVLEPEYEHLIDSAWALAVHERVADVDVDAGLLARSGGLAALSPRERPRVLARVAADIDWHHGPSGDALAEAVYEQSRNNERE